MIDLTQKTERTLSAEQWVESHQITRFFSSHTALAFFYGAFLFLYELKFLRQLIPVVHPVLIAWAGLLFLYDVLVRRCWTKIPLWKVLALFVVSVLITSALNIGVSVSISVKSAILTLLPLVAFYPVCLLASPEEREKSLLTAMLGAAIVIFFASLIALVLYMMRFGRTVEFLGLTEHVVGIGLYDPRYADSGIILYGLYKDTNHPAGYSIIFSCYSIALFFGCRKGIFDRKWQNILGMVFAVANLIVQLCYFPLANSRGGWLSLGVSLFISAFLYLFSQRWSKRGAAVRVIGSFAAALACVVLVCGCLVGVRGGLSHLSIALEQKKIQAEMPPEPGTSDPGTAEPGTPEPGTPDPGTAEPEPSKPETPDPPPLMPVDNATVDSFEKENEHFGAERFEIWKEALKLYLNRPVFGEEPGNSAYYTEQYFAEGESVHLIRGKALHNSYLDLLLDYGAVGFVLLMSFFALCAWRVMQAVLRREMSFGISYFIIVCSVVMVACSSFLLSCVFINTTAMYFSLLVMVGYLISGVSGLLK